MTEEHYVARLNGRRIATPFAGTPRLVDAGADGLAAMIVLPTGRLA